MHKVKKRIIKLHFTKNRNFSSIFQGPVSATRYSNHQESLKKIFQQPVVRTQNVKIIRDKVGNNPTTRQ